MDDYCRHMSVYFRPWTLRPEDASRHCPLLSNLDGGTGWSSAWHKYLHGNILNEHCRNTISNFQEVFSTRQAVDADNASSATDSCHLVLEGDELSTALQTKRRSADSSAVASSFSFVESAWGQASGAHGGVQQAFSSMPDDLGVALAAARSCQKEVLGGAPKTTVGDATGASIQVSQSQYNISAVVSKWLNDMTMGTGDGLKCRNSEQKEVVSMIASRVLEEHNDTVAGCVGRSKPISALITGGPGVGKSFVVKAARSLFDALGYNNGVDYAFTALQAVVASQLDGQTLHSLFGINLYGQVTTVQSKLEKIANRLSNTRWIIIDEISQVTCELLAECEQQARALVQEAETYRCCWGSAVVRAWAGINVLYVGDFLQLPPPGNGMFLSAIPDNAMLRLHPKKATVTHGLGLLWENESMKVIELTEQIRCTDPWWNSVLQEFRIGKLSQDSHAFLHGKPTSTPGSWNNVDSTCACNNPRCIGLVSHAWGHIKRNECSECCNERKRRFRVIKPKDARLTETKYKDAITVVANNDLKYEICKARASEFARSTGQRVTWAPAQDTARADALTHDKDLRAKKVRWLQYHSRKCEGLWGMLPLVVGMRVALTDHLDRSEKCLLKGTSGTLLGWELNPCEPPHPDTGDVCLRYPVQCIIVQFGGCVWKLPGMTAVGTYPIKKSTKSWHLNGDRKLPVSRTQVPVGPDYARTAYSTQGLTLDATIVDLCFDNNTDPITAYVALSRVRSASDILIMQAFPIEVFQQGVPIGPKLLLKKLRGESIEAEVAEHLQKQREMIEFERIQKLQDERTRAEAKHCAKKAQASKAMKNLRQDGEHTAKVNKKRRKTEAQWEAKRLLQQQAKERKEEERLARKEERLQAKKARVEETLASKEEERLERLQAKKARVEETLASTQERRRLQWREAAKKFRNKKRARDAEGAAPGVP